MVIRSRSPRLFRHLYGLTLIEVVIILIVLVILAVFLFPIFARPREGNGRHNCLSNEKQLGLAMMQYMQDNNQCFPPRQSISNGKTVSWRASLFDYLKSVPIYVCPENPAVKLPDFERDGYPRSYAVDSAPGGAFGDDHPHADISTINNGQRKAIRLASAGGARRSAAK